MQRVWKISFLAVTLLILPLAGSGQIAPVTIDDIISKADAQRRMYVDEFRNLLSEETKTLETFDKKGDVKKRRSVKSIFIVYQLSKDEKQIAEYRNVVAVDGKPLEKTEQRAQDFFEKIGQVESTEKELDRIQAESSRFDEDISLEGFTLFQAVPLADNLRPYFEFKLEGKDNIDGANVYVVSYRQIKDSPYILLNPKNDIQDAKLTLNYAADFSDGESLNQRLFGKFWIDAETFQTRREVRSMTVKPKDFETPVLLSETVFEYQKSDFGILTPRKISYTEYRIKKKEAAAKQIRATFEYEKFTKPDVEVKSGDVKQP